jgi:tRNA(Ile)-lysidine synthase
MVKTDFLARMETFIRRQKLFGAGETLLCAVSGGIDSMVMVHALQALGYRLEIAHVNFQLRGEDSDRDELLVQEWALQSGCPFHLKRAGSCMKMIKGSLQERARNFRYGWLEKLARQRNISHLLLAHHAEDQTETLLLQYFRGAGISGRQGMKPASGMRKRPLMPFTRSEISAFAADAGIAWREDVSNSSDAYLRNRIRHHLKPLLDELFPGFPAVLERNATRLSITSAASEFLYRQLYNEFLNVENSDFIEFSLERIHNHPMAVFFMVELLLNHHFSFPDAFDLSQKTGAEESLMKRNSKGLVLEIRYPRMLLWKNLDDADFAESGILLESPLEKSCLLSGGQKLNVRLVDGQQPGQALHSWQYPVEKVGFPLRLRHWRSGDRIQLPGMAGKRKKLSDLFSEARLTGIEKKRILVLEDAGGQILWIPGFRIAANAETSGSRWLQLEILPD